MFSETSEKQFKTLTGRKLSTGFLSSVFLSIGLTEATFSFLGNSPFLYYCQLTVREALPKNLLLI